MVRSNTGSIGHWRAVVSFGAIDAGALDGFQIFAPRVADATRARLSCDTDEYRSSPRPSFGFDSARRFVAEQLLSQQLEGMQSSLTGPVENLVPT